MEEFKIPKTKEEYNKLSIQEQQLIVYLFGTRAIEVTQELQAFTFSMSLFYSSPFDKEKIGDVFRVLSYTPMHGMFLGVKEEYDKALALAHTKIKAIRFATALLGASALAIFSGAIDIAKLMGG